MIAEFSSMNSHRAIVQSCNLNHFQTKKKKSWIFQDKSAHFEEKEVITLAITTKPIVNASMHGLDAAIASGFSEPDILSLIAEQRTTTKKRLFSASDWLWQVFCSKLWCIQVSALALTPCTVTSSLDWQWRICSACEVCPLNWEGAFSLKGTHMGMWNKSNGFGTSILSGLSSYLVFLQLAGVSLVRDWAISFKLSISLTVGQSSSTFSSYYFAVRLILSYTLWSRPFWRDNDVKPGDAAVMLTRVQFGFARLASCCTIEESWTRETDQNLSGILSNDFISTWLLWKMRVSKISTPLSN